MRILDIQMLDSFADHMPHSKGEHCVDPSRPGNGVVCQDDNKYLPAMESIAFPGPLMSGQMQVDDLIRFIQWRAQECLRHVDEPGEKEAYFFWRIMELFCCNNGRVLLVEIATLLFKGYGLLRSKLRGRKNKDSWCLPLAQLLCSADSEDRILDDVLAMGEKLDEKGLTWAAHLCYVVTREDLQTCEGSSFELIGCNSLPVSQSALREAIERTEVYEYVSSLTTGFAQPNFQIYKCYHASKLAESGLMDQALDYCKTIAAAITTFPQDTTKTTLELAIVLSERLQQGEGHEPEWLMNLRQFHADDVFNPKDKRCGLLTLEMFGIQGPHLESNITPWEVFESLYTPGELLGKGGFGSVCAGTRNKDGKEVAIKYVGKSQQDEFLTIPGETRSLPLEVALMEMASKPFPCSNVLELMEWFEMSDCYILILERPSPCIDLRQFLADHNSGLPESLVQKIMCQVVQAARHCCDRGVLHRDIKAENLLINLRTMEVKLIDFGCGDLLKDTTYRNYAGTLTYYPPEWVLEREYFGQPATIWSLGVLLFHLVCGYLPFRNKDDICNRNMRLAPGLSEDCRDLIFWCLQRHPHARPTFNDILNHAWLAEKNPVDCEMSSSHITPWEEFEAQYTLGEILGEGGYGTVCAGVRKGDGIQVAIKFVEKTENDQFVTIPGETQRLPLEVALMKMVSKPSPCDNVLELIEWIETSDSNVLILERPSPCTDLRQFLKCHDGRLSEPLAQKIMRQVVRAARHCCDCGVLHRDIKADNLLINTDTLEVKLIDFGCGDLLKDTAYEEYEGTWTHSPPEWVCEGEYLGRPATIWSLGVLLFHLICGYLPFHNEDDIVYHKMNFAPGVSEDCHHLIDWCMDQDPDSRPNFDEILHHEWFNRHQN